MGKTCGLKLTAVDGRLMWLQHFDNMTILQGIEIEIDCFKIVSSFTFVSSGSRTPVLFGPGVKWFAGSTSFHFEDLRFRNCFP